MKQNKNLYRRNRGAQERAPPLTFDGYSPFTFREQPAAGTAGIQETITKINIKEFPL